MFCMLFATEGCTETPVWLPWPASSAHRIWHAWKTLAWQEQAIQQFLGFNLLNRDATAAALAGTIAGPALKHLWSASSFAPRHGTPPSRHRQPAHAVSPQTLWARVYGLLSSPSTGRSSVARTLNFDD